MLLRRSFLNLLLFLHHLPLIFILIISSGVEVSQRAIFTLPFGILIVFINASFIQWIVEFCPWYRDIEPTIKALMAPMLLLTPVLWKPEMLGTYQDMIYYNSFYIFYWDC